METEVGVDFPILSLSLMLERDMCYHVLSLFIMRKLFFIVSLTYQVERSQGPRQIGRDE